MTGIDGNWADEECRSDYHAADHDRDLPDLADVIDPRTPAEVARSVAEGAQIARDNSWGPLSDAARGAL